MTNQASDNAFNPAFDKMPASARRGSSPAFGGLEAAAEVEGHILEDGAFAASAHPDAGPAFGGLEAAAEVDGHAVKVQSSETGAASALDDETPEVEGHVHPILMEDYSRLQAANSEAAAIRAQRVREARTGRDGGIVDKVLRRKRK